MKRLHVLFGLTLMASMSGCSDDASNADSSATGEDSTSASSGETSSSEGMCVEGTEDCPCFGNQTCLDGLTCQSDVCVPGGDGDGDSTQGEASTGDGDGDSTGDGDGDSTSGDGDGDSTGDGDGDSTTGDGDGDATTGDGDGDATTGDGDGDGDATTGDGDGDSTTGDGDGDGDSGDGDGDGTSGDGDGDGTGGDCTTQFDKRCNGAGDVETCSASFEWEVTSLCPANCFSGQCTSASTCLANEYRCNINLIEQCNAQGTGWLVNDYCDLGCNPSNYTCQGTCDPDDLRCVGDGTQKCDGAGVWQDEEDCGGPNVCHSGVCDEDSLTLTGTTTTMCGEVWIDGPVVLGSLATLNVGSCGFLSIHADTISVDATSTIDASAGACNPDGLGQGDGGDHYRDGGGGGGHSGSGVTGYNYSGTSQPGGGSIGSPTELTADIGGCGGNGGSAGVGRLGGGVIELYADSTIQIDGNLLADGGNTSSGNSSAGSDGAGAGGSIVLYSRQVTIGDSATLSAAGGTSPGGSYTGGAGADGHIKILYGLESASSIGSATFDPPRDGTDDWISVAPPWELSSSTHPDEDAWYNDGFNAAEFAWQRPSPYAVQGYYWTFNQAAYGVPTPGTGTFNDSENHNEPYTSSWNDDQSYFHVMTLDDNNVPGTVEHTYRIQVNSQPPTIDSSSHANEALFYTANDVALNWSDPHDTANYTDYVYIFDRFANTTPTPTFGIHETVPSVFEQDRPGGVWFLHVISIDTMGYPTREADHFRINIGDAAPAAGSIAGTVKDSVSNANVTNATLSINGGIWVRTTDAIAGAYSFENAGVYETTDPEWPEWKMLVSAPGYVSKEIDVTVTPGGVTTQNVLLDPI